jgi:peptidyl-prolyl cis-trans isomerase B (cyclophilin B)
MAEQCVILETESGKIELEMYPEQAPETVRNFLRLTSLGFYDTTSFARVVPNFVVQGGNFGTRLSKPYELYAYARNIQDEPNLIKHERGVLSMARGDEANSASTHFFILVNEAKYLDGKFAAFGRVTKGIEVVEAINKMPVVEEKPVKPVRLLKAITSPCPIKKEQ